MIGDILDIAGPIALILGIVLAACGFIGGAPGGR